MTAFTKILSVYDKNTGWHFAPIYMKEVEGSYFATSTKVSLVTCTHDREFIATSRNIFNAAATMNLSSVEIQV